MPTENCCHADGSVVLASATNSGVNSAVVDVSGCCHMDINSTRAPGVMYALKEIEQPLSTEVLVGGDTTAGTWLTRSTT